MKKKQKKKHYGLVRKLLWILWTPLLLVGLILVAVLGVFLAGLYSVEYEKDEYIVASSGYEDLDTFYLNDSYRLVVTDSECLPIAEKFNGYILSQVDDYFRENGKCPDEETVKNKIGVFRDLIAYRIVISMPKCHLKPGENREEEEIKHLYKIANALPDILEKQGFSMRPADHDEKNISTLLDEKVRCYYRDYIQNPAEFGYKSLHITLYDNLARCYIEVQLRTKAMDDNAEIGPANHLGYEKRQEYERARRDKIPVGECKCFDEAYDRVTSLQNLELSELDVNMFSAVNNSLINDGCGLFRGRLILPFEHLSRFQNDVLD